VTRRSELSLPAVPESLARARAHLVDVVGPTVTPEELFDLQVAVGEACTNVIRHAAAPVFTVRVLVGEADVTVEVEDRGRGVDPSALAVPLPAEGPSGRGFALMRALVDAVEVTASPGGTCVRLRKRRTPVAW
jgi:serine/threonine-protein kinase RsbW